MCAPYMLDKLKVMVTNYFMKRLDMKIEISRFKDSSLNFGISGKYFHHSDSYLSQLYYLLEGNRKNKIKVEIKDCLEEVEDL